MNKMKKLRIAVVLIFILIVASMFIGCTSSTNLATQSAEDSLEEAGVRGYNGDATQITTKDSESHQMVVKMRLLQYEMSPELDDYDDVFLVDMKNENGDIITVVVINENGKMTSLLPENVQ